MAQLRSWAWWKQTVVPIFVRSEMGAHAAQVAYYIILTIIPTFLVIGNLIPMLPINYETVIDYMMTIIPENLHQYVVPVVRNYLTSPNNNAISIGVLVALWSTSKTFTSLQMVFNKIYGVSNRKNFLWVQLFSFLTSLFAAVLLAVTVVIFAFGNQLLQVLQQVIGFDAGILMVFERLRWILAPIILVVIMTFIYFFVPNVRRFVGYSVPGALVATIGMLLVSQLYSVYGMIVGRQAITNGTIGVIMVLIIWLYVLSNVVIFGAITNVIVYEAMHSKRIRNEGFDGTDDKK